MFRPRASRTQSSLTRTYFMQHCRPSARLALAALALWLGLWPACDAVTSLSARSQLVPTPAVAAPAACCGERDAGATPCASRAPQCHAAKTPKAAPDCPHAKGTCSEGDCAGTKAARCAQCFSVGGLLLFATPCLSVDPELALIGTLGATRIARASRQPQPLLRPPILPLPIAA